MLQFEPMNAQPWPFDNGGRPIYAPQVSRQQQLVSNAPLTASNTFAQSWQDADALGVNYVHGSVYSDQSGTLYVDLADDQSHPMLGVTSVSVTGGTPIQLPNATSLSTRYFRFRYVNGSTTQTTFELYQNPMAYHTPRDINASLTGSNVTLATTVSATGAQTAQNVANGTSSLRLNVWGTATSFDVQVQGIMFDGTPRTLKASNAIDGTSVGNDITSAGVYDFDTGGWQQVQLNVVSVSGGNVNAKGVFLP